MTRMTSFIFVYCLTCMKSIFSDCVAALCDKPAEDHMEMHRKKDGKEPRIIVGRFVEGKEKW